MLDSRLRGNDKGRGDDRRTAWAKAHPTKLFLKKAETQLSVIGYQ